jgi:hypothetical protein
MEDDRPGIGGQTFTMKFEDGWWNKTAFFITMVEEGTDPIIDEMVNRYNKNTDNE